MVPTILENVARQRAEDSPKKFLVSTPIFAHLFGAENHRNPSMKVLFDHSFPFALAHGGFQIQIEQTKNALAAGGLEVEWLRWWDDGQKGDVIHFFGRPSSTYLHYAHQKQIKVVVGELLTGPGSRSGMARATQKTVMTLAQKILPAGFTAKLAWDVYARADAAVALTSWEAQLMREMFDAPPERVHVVPNGVEPVFFQSAPVTRGPWLVCTAVITERKRILELARAAVAAQTPLWIIGKPYAENDPYALRFLQLVAAHPQLLRYEGPLYDRAKLAVAYRAARGFVLLSTMESLSLSALEAAACECPLLLSELPWARSVFASHADYCPITPDTTKTARCLRTFYDDAPGKPAPPKPLTWQDVGRQLQGIYEGLFKTSR